MEKIIFGREYPAVVIKLVKDAQQSIKILMYVWMWYDGEIGASIQKFNNEIIQANLRGVDVTALVNLGNADDKLRQQKINVKRIYTTKIMHIKLVIVDDKYLLIGSHNFTKRAFDLNHEVSVFIDDPVSVDQCVKFFNTFNI